MVAKKSKKTPKPEYSIKVVAKKAPAAKKNIPKKKPQKPIKMPLFWGKLSGAKKVKFIFSGVLAVIILTSFIAVVLSLIHTNNALDSAAKVADSLNTTDANTSKNAKLIGSNEQLTKEIDNFASSPADLQVHAFQDIQVHNIPLDV
jgi:cell division protein FtsB